MISLKEDGPPKKRRAGFENIKDLTDEEMSLIETLLGDSNNELPSPTLEEPLKELPRPAANEPRSVKKEMDDMLKRESKKVQKEVLPERNRLGIPGAQTLEHRFTPEQDVKGMIDDLKVSSELKKKVKSGQQLTATERVRIQNAIDKIERVNL